MTFTAFGCEFGIRDQLAMTRGISQRGVVAALTAACYSYRDLLEQADQACPSAARDDGLPLVHGALPMKVLLPLLVSRLAGLVRAALLALLHPVALVEIVPLAEVATDDVVWHPPPPSVAFAIVAAPIAPTAPPHSLAT